MFGLLVGIANSSFNVSDGINVTLSPDSGKSGNTVNMNFTVNDTHKNTSWFNFTFPGSSFDITGAIIQFLINGVVSPGWENSTGSDYIYLNVTGGGTVAYSGVTSYINFSNITVIGGATSTYSTYVTVRTNNSGDITVEYNVTAASSGGSTPPSSSGGGGGGGGGASGENASNIEVSEKYDIQISKDVLTSYRFTHAKNPIMFVNITGNTSLGVITASIEVLKNTSTLVKVSPDGLVYKNANIWVGTSGFATPKNIKQALIKFRVDNAWMSTNGVSASDIVLVKWDGKSWIDLETKALSKDDTNSYFEGKTNTFSPFAIVAKTTSGAKPAFTTPPAPAGTSKITTTVAPEPTKKTPGFGIVLAILGLMAVVLRKRSW